MDRRCTWSEWRSRLSVRPRRFSPATSLRPHDVDLVLHRQRRRRNRVDCRMRLDASCAPCWTGSVFPYWRESKAPPVRTKPMGAFSKIGYGISAQKTLRHTPTGGGHDSRPNQVDRILSPHHDQGRDATSPPSFGPRSPVSTTRAPLHYVKLSRPLSGRIDIGGRIWRQQAARRAVLALGRPTAGAFTGARGWIASSRHGLKVRLRLRARNADAAICHHDGFLRSLSRISSLADAELPRDFQSRCRRGSQGTR
jgi:hypothetical protein